MTQIFAEQQSVQLPYRLLKLALVPDDRSALHQRIAVRFDQMLAAGLVDEVIALRSKYPALHAELPSMRCVGYRQAWQYLDGEIGLDALREKGIAATRQLAKRQLTWLRGMDDTVNFNCLEPDLNGRLCEYIKAWLA